MAKRLEPKYVRTKNKQLQNPHQPAARLIPMPSTSSVKAASALPEAETYSSADGTRQPELTAELSIEEREPLDAIGVSLQRRRRSGGVSSLTRLEVDRSVVGEATLARDVF